MKPEGNALAPTRCRGHLVLDYWGPLAWELGQEPKLEEGAALIGAQGRQGGRSARSIDHGGGTKRKIVRG